MILPTKASDYVSKWIKLFYFSLIPLVMKKMEIAIYK